MATLDFTHAAFGVDTTEPGFIDYAAALGTGTATSWSFVSTAGNRVHITGTGMTFDAAGRPTGGTATAIEIDVDNNGSVDLVITGIAAPAATLDDGPASFWRFLDGNDVVLGPESAQGAANGIFRMFGDGLAARNGATGGNDILQLGDRIGGDDGRRLHGRRDLGGRLSRRRRRDARPRHQRGAVRLWRRRARLWRQQADRRRRHDPDPVGGPGRLRHRRRRPGLVAQRQARDGRRRRRHHDRRPLLQGSARRRRLPDGGEHPRRGRRRQAERRRLRRDPRRRRPHDAGDRGRDRAADRRRRRDQRQRRRRHHRRRPLPDHQPLRDDHRRQRHHRRRGRRRRHLRRRLFRLSGPPRASPAATT